MLIEKRRQNIINFYQPWACRQKWLRMRYKPLLH